MGDGRTEQLPDLDYAFLAEYAKVDPAGTLTVVGASFTQLTDASLPMGLPISIAGRVRMRQDSPGTMLRISFYPDGAEDAALDAELSIPPGGAHAYEGRVGVLFAVNTVVPVFAPGRQRVQISVDGLEVRNLYFQVTEGESATGTR